MHTSGKGRNRVRIAETHHDHIIKIMLASGTNSKKTERDVHQTQNALCPHAFKEIAAVVIKISGLLKTPLIETDYVKSIYSLIKTKFYLIVALKVTNWQLHFHSFRFLVLRSLTAVFDLMSLRTDEPNPVFLPSINFFRRPSVWRPGP